MAYGLIIGFMGQSLTSREFQNRTFELFELSGMSLEGMIRGKLVSMLYQFFFGFFCVVPFMFFAYFLGGLDFLELISGVLVMMLGILPFYLLSLLSSLMTRLKQIALLGRAAGIVGAIVTVVSLLSVVFGNAFSSVHLFRGISDLLKEVLALNTTVLLGIGAFFVFYIQICFLLFYICCHVISRENDSREIPIKLLCVTLTASWIGFVAYMSIIHGPQKDMEEAIGIPVFLGMCVLLLAFYFNRARVPAIIALKYQHAKGLRRIFYAWFQPGCVGAFRTYFIMLLLLSVALLCILPLTASLSSVSSSRPVQTFENVAPVLSWAFQLPFFLIFPVAFLARTKELQANYTAQRTFAGLIWGAGGIITIVVLSSLQVHRPIVRPLFEVCAVLISPLSSAFSEFQVGSGVRDAAIPLRLATGVLGFVMIIKDLRHRKRAEELARAVPDASPIVQMATPAATDTEPV
jgi:hypothetical protein